MSRYLPRDRGYPFQWDDFFGPRTAPRRIPVQPRRPVPPQMEPEPLTEPDPMLERHRSAMHESEMLRAEKDELARELASARGEAEALRAEAEALRTDLTAKEIEVEELSKLAKQHRLRAVDAEHEIELAKDRIERESAKALEQKRRAFATDLLQVLDDLDRALAVCRKDEPDSALVEGVELVRKGFLSKLEAHDIHHEPSEGKPFDPARHQAISTAPVEDPELDGAVVAVIREGYRVGEDTLRAADVVVGKYNGPA